LAADCQKPQSPEWLGLSDQRLEVLENALFWAFFFCVRPRFNTQRATDRLLARSLGPAPFFANEN